MPLSHTCQTTQCIFPDAAPFPVYRFNFQIRLLQQKTTWLPTANYFQTNKAQQPITAHHCRRRHFRIRRPKTKVRNYLQTANSDEHVHNNILQLRYVSFLKRNSNVCLVIHVRRRNTLFRAGSPVTNILLSIRTLEKYITDWKSYNILKMSNTLLGNRKQHHQRICNTVINNKLEMRGKV